jgi:hypothetical protein
MLNRILEHDGWLAPCAGAHQLTLSDLDIVRSAVQEARIDAPLHYVHVQWTHVIDTDDREKALAGQLGPFGAVADKSRATDDLASAYVMGSVQDIRDRVESIAAAGFDALIIGPVVADPAQFELIAHVANVAARG